MTNTTTAGTASYLLECRRDKGGHDAALIAAVERQSTAVLLAAHAELTGRPTVDSAERLTMATIADVLTARHDLDELLDEIYMDDEYDGTYHAAILEALARAGVEI